MLEGKPQNNKLDNINLLKSRPGKIYIDGKGTSLGCDGLSECFAFKVVFYSFDYNKENNEFLIGGTIYVDGTAKDSVKVAGVEILLAQPHKDTLTNIRIIGNSVVDKNTLAEFPQRRGDF